MKNTMENLEKTARDKLQSSGDTFVSVGSGPVGLMLHKVWCGGCKTTYRRNWYYNGEPISAKKLLTTPS